MRFFKYHGLGNDFIVLAPESPDFRIDAGLDAALARHLCDRSFGIGADGAMVVAPPRDPANDAAMELINSDGSIPEMCGNGIRCAAKYAVDQLGLRSNPLRIETPGGVRACAWTTDASGSVAEVSVAMGPATFACAAIPVVGDGDADHIEVDFETRRFVGTGVNVGNPHYVTFGDSTVATALAWGPRLEAHPRFPEKANIEFATVEGPNTLRVTVWERACGLTWACGTGATAAAAAAARHGLVDPSVPIDVHLRGGPLTIDLSNPNDAVMRGPATIVFMGDIAFANDAPT